MDATGDECLGNEKTGQWIDGHVDTFWAYDYPHPGTTAYYVHTRSWGVQTFWVGLKRHHGIIVSHFGHLKLLQGCSQVRNVIVGVVN